MLFGISHARLKDLPRQLQAQFKEMMEAWTRERPPGGEEWSVATSVARMDDEEARRWLEEILKLYTGVVERKAAAETYSRKHAIRSEQRCADLAQLEAKKEKAIDVFCEVYRLLEDFAPTRYPEELRERARKALRVLGRDNDESDEGSDPVRKAS